MIEMKNKMNSIIYLSHGGGPLPILADKSHIKMIEFMRTLPETINRPEAIVVFSAHWEESIVTITSSNTLNLIYDYYGFPEESYAIEYNVPGDNDLSHKIKGTLFQKTLVAN